MYYWQMIINIYLMFNIADLFANLIRKYEKKKTDSISILAFLP